MAAEASCTRASEEGRGCPGRDALAAFSEGDLAESRLCAIAEHLETCPRCLAELETSSVTVRAVDRPGFQFEKEPECARMVGAAKNLPWEAPIQVVLGDVEGSELRRLAEADTESAGHSSSTPLGSAVVRRAPGRPPEFPERYEMRRFLGRGGFGEVFAAFDRELEREVALKLMREDRLDEQHVAQFRDEARKLAQIRHRAVLDVYDVGRVEHRWYIVTQLVSGGTLLERIRKRPLAVAEAIQIVAEVAEGLHAAHRLGIIHRDIKPANVLLEASGQPRLTDFGLAVTEEEQLHELDGQLGTVAYMAPEQIRGDNRFMDARSDVYALGNVLYEALTGRLPFLGKNRDDYLDQICNRLPRPLSTLRDDVPRSLERICLKCLEKNPADRYTTAAELARELRGLQGVQPLARRRLLRSAGLGVGAAAMGLLGWQIWSAIQPSPDARPTGRDQPVAPVSDNEVLPEVLVWQDSLEQNTLVVTGANSFVVNTQGIAVLGLGIEGPEKTTAKITLSMRVRQSPADIRWGVFHDYGLRRTPQVRKVQYQTVEPNTAAKVPKVEVGYRGFSPDLPQDPSSAEITDVPVPTLTADTRIEIQFFAGTLHAVRINGRDLPSLSGIPRPRSLVPPEERPRFGVFVVRGAMSVSEILVNGQPPILDNVKRP